MRMFAALAVAVAVGGVFVSLPPRATADQKITPEGRRKLATDIVVGSVSDLFTKTIETDRHGEGTIEVRYLFEVQVEKVEKGGLTPGEVLYVRAWHIDRSGANAKESLHGGLWGHKPLPKVGDRVRAFVVHGPYKDGNQADNGYAAVYPTGLVTLPADAE